MEKIILTRILYEMMYIFDSMVASPWVWQAVWNKKFQSLGLVDDVTTGSIRASGNSDKQMAKFRKVQRWLTHTVMERWGVLATCYRGSYTEHAIQCRES